MKKVLISGGTGLVGERLSKMLEEKGYAVAHLSRSERKSNRKTIVWDVDQMQLDAKEIEAFDGIIHLAGAGIVDKPWSEERKKTIQSSRVDSSRLLKEAISQNAKRPSSFVSASAIGYYGFTSSAHIHNETDPAGNDFLADTCVLWENSVDEIAQLGIPTAKIRIGIVLSKDGGALKAMAQPVLYGLGAPLGTGNQYIQWIHIDDLCRIFIHALENNLEGAYNAAVPSSKQVNNRTFIHTLGKVLHRPVWLPRVPAFVMKLILGKRALLVLEGSRVSSQKIQESGFDFLFENLEDALKDLYS